MRPPTRFDGVDDRGVARAGLLVWLSPVGTITVRLAPGKYHTARQRLDVGQQRVDDPGEQPHLHVGMRDADPVQVDCREEDVSRAIAVWRRDRAGFAGSPWRT